MNWQLLATRSLVAAGVAVVSLAGGLQGHAQPAGDFVPVTDAMLQAPAPEDWLTWRRTTDGWGYSPLDQIDRENVGDLRMVWSRGLTQGFQSGTPLAYRGVLYMPNPNDVIQAIDAVTGDLIWEHRRDVPDDVGEYLLGGLATNNRNIAIYDRLIIDTSVDTHVFALDAETGEMVWETQVLDYRENAAMQGAGPIIANGKAVSGRSCLPRGGPEACVVVAHDALTGAEAWRRRLVPAPGEPGDESWGGVPFEERTHVGAWMVPSYDPALDLIYVGTSVTSPAPKFMLGGVDLQHLYHNSTLALDAGTGDIRWYYQHLNDHWDLDHPFERILVDTAVAPDPSQVSWINPRLQPGETRRVVTGIPGKTGVVYHPRPGDGRVPVGHAHRRPERHQRHRRRHRRGDRERRGHLHRGGPAGLRVPHLERRQGLGGRRLQPADQHHVHAPAQHLRPHDGDAGLPRGRAAGRAQREPLGAVRHRLPPPARARATRTRARYARSRPRPAPRCGSTSSARRRCRSWRRAAGSSSAATSTAGSGPSTRRRATCCGRSTWGRR